jgi:tRNA pseudouridine38-40 synthase
MDASVACLVGEHDYAAFCRRHGDTSTIRRVLWAGWRRSGDIVELSIGATSFCHQMVRSIVAVSVDVGRGRLPADAMAGILASRDRSRAKGVAPPQGLFLVAVAYGDEPLPRPTWVPLTS